MAKLTDPDSFSLNVNGTPTTEEVAIDTGAKTIELRVAGTLDDTSPGKTSGAVAKAVYSFLKEEWLNGTDAATLRRFKFPIKMIFEGSFIFTNGWAPANDQTRDLFRDAGFLEQTTGRENTCMVSLGTMDDSANDQAYYSQVAGFTAATTNFDKTGEINENVETTSNKTFFKAFLREQGKQYGEYSLLVEQDLATLATQAYSFPLTNATDTNVTASDNTIDTTAPYNTMTINYLQGVGFTTWASSTVYPANSVVQSSGGRWFHTTAGGTSAGNDTDLAGGSDTGVTWAVYDGEIQIGSSFYAFNRIVDAGTGTNTQAYEYMQRQLRQTGNINSDTGLTAGQGGYGTVNGKVAELLGEFVGADLIMAPGVGLTNFDSNSTNNIKHQPITVDSGGLNSVDVPSVFTTVSYPFVAAGTFVFSDNLVDQPDAQTFYTVYFEYTRSVLGSTTIGATAGGGSVATFADSGSAMNVQAGDYFLVEGFTDTTLNGLWLETGGSPTASSVTATKQDGATVGTEAAGNSINFKINPYESPSAEIVQNNSASNLDAQITAKSIAFDFDYTNNAQDGRPSNSDALCVVVAQALDGAEWIDANFTITEATGINVPVNASDERNYENN